MKKETKKGKNGVEFIKKIGKKPNGNYKFLCKCTCGNEFECWENAFYSGNPHCGCKNIWKTNKELATIWNNMHTRCTNPKSDRWDRYGGRGIKLCNGFETFEGFIEWAKTSGYKKGLSIERKDINKNYEPNNCTWIKLEKQARNRKDTIKVIYKGEQIDLTTLCEQLNLKRDTVKYRLKQGYPLEIALSKEKLCCGKDYTKFSKYKKEEKDFFK